jgi:hypothetical protein
MDNLPKELIIEIANYTIDIDLPLRRVSKLFNTVLSDISVIDTSINMYKAPFIFVKEYYTMLSSLGVRIFNNNHDTKELKALRSKVEQITEQNKDILQHETYQCVVLGYKVQENSLLGQTPLKTFIRHRKTLNELIKLYWQITVFPNTHNDIYYLIELYKEKEQLLQEMKVYLSYNNLEFFFKYTGGHFDIEITEARFIHIELTKIKNNHFIKKQEILNPFTTFNSIYHEYYSNKLLIETRYFSTNVCGFTNGNDHNMLLALAYIDYHSYNHESINLDLLYNLYDCYTAVVYSNNNEKPLFTLNINTERVDEMPQEVPLRMKIALNYAYNTKTKILPTLSRIQFIF